MSPDILPIFPLPLVTFPDEKVNLHIFEPRYKQLIVEAEANKTTFGIPTYIEKQKLSFGTEVELVEIVEKYKDGKIDIRIKGKRIFEVLNFIPRMAGRLYSGADIKFLKHDVEIDFGKNIEILALLSDLYQFLKMHKPLPKDEFSFNSYSIGHFIGLSVKDELNLLGITREIDRQEFIIRHLQTIIPILREMNALEKKIKMNGHFKNLIPPNL
jgi:Lon protease-like protein